MNKTICTLRDIPQPVNISGDYYITQSALMLGSMGEGEVRLKNADRSKDTKLMIAFLKSMGCKISVDDSEIVMSPSNSPVSLDGKEIYYGGGVYPLALVIGYLAGKGRKCTLNYTNDINPIFIAKLTKSFSEIGIGLKHNNESHHIEFGQNQLIPIEREISAVFPHTKDSLLMLGLSSGRSVAIREKLLSDIKVENIIIKLGGKLTFRETKPELVDNPDDPRKKLRQAKFNYKREMILHPSTHLRGAVIEVPADSYQLAAWLALAILKKTEFRSEGLHITAETKDFVNYLKSAGAGISLAKNSSPDSGIKKIDLYLGKSEISGRKISGNAAAGLMKKIALMAILAAGRPATTLIRDIKEYDDIAIDPFVEIATHLGKMGIKCGILEDGLVIEGKSELNGGDFGLFHNREIAMAFYLAALTGHGKSTFENFEIINDNYPDFVAMMENIAGRKNHF